MVFTGNEELDNDFDDNNEMDFDLKNAIEEENESIRIGKRSSSQYTKKVESYIDSDAKTLRFTVPANVLEKVYSGFVRATRTENIKARATIKVSKNKQDSQILLKKV